MITISHTGQLLTGKIQEYSLVSVIALKALLSFPISHPLTCARLGFLL